MHADCILSTYACGSNGYPHLKHKGGTVHHHRLVYAQSTNTPISEMKFLVVMHRCDNPKCINPEHLKLGTASDNMKDMVAKKRNVGNKRLSDMTIAAIMLAYRSSAKTHEDIAIEFKVSKATVGDIISQRRAYAK